MPAPQAALPPQRQPPDAPHISARAGSQVTQAAPPPPQVITPAMLHVEPEQQPEQLPGLHPLHTPPAQGPVPQFWHIAPPLPQIASAVPG